MKSIKMRMVMIFSLVSCIIFAIAGITIYSAASRGMTQLSENLGEDIVSGKVENVSSLIDRKMAELNVMVEYDGIKEMDIEESSRYLNYALETSDFSTISLVYPSGMAYGPDGSEYDFSSSEYMGPIFEDGEEEYLTSPFPSSIDGRPMVVFAKAVKNFNGQTVGLLSGSMYLDELTATISEISLEDSGFGWLMNTEGDILIHKDFEDLSDNNIADLDGRYAELGENIEELNSSEKGVELTEVNGEDTYIIYSDIEGSPGWMLMIEVPRSAMMSGLSQFFMTFIGLLVVAIVIMVILSYIAANVISKPIKQLTEESKSLINLDISNDISEDLLKKTDEIGDLSKVIQLVTESLRETLNKIGEISGTVSSASEELTVTSDESSRASEEIAKSIEEMAKTASDQAVSTESGAQNIYDLGTLLEKNDSLILELNESRDKIDGYKNEGNSILEDLVDKSNRNSEASKRVQSVMSETRESSSKIQDASSMIESISEQTNLLALNAAIEAARAGESGKGFAVVAEEIRKLAEQSSSFANDINTVVNELGQKTKEAVDVTNELEEIALSQNNSVEETREKFAGIDVSVDEMKGVMEEVNQSVQEMTTKKEEIVAIIENLSAAAEENAATTEESSASVEEQTAAMIEISNASESLAKLAEEMEENIKRFKL